MQSAVRMRCTRSVDQAVGDPLVRCDPVVGGGMLQDDTLIRLHEQVPRRFSA
jgi:hypothetical protein